MTRSTSLPFALLTLQLFFGSASIALDVRTVPSDTLYVYPLNENRGIYWPAPYQWSSWLERARTFPRYCGLMDLDKTVCGAGGLYPRELCGLTML